MKRFRRTQSIRKPRKNQARTSRKMKNIHKDIVDKRKSFKKKKRNIELINPEDARIHRLLKGKHIADA